MGMYVICEIDGVLADARHRQNLSQGDRLVAGDDLIFPTSRMLRGFERSGAEIVLICQRSHFTEEPTKQWLKECGISYDWLHLNPGSKEDYVKHIAKVIKAHRDDRLIAGICRTGPLTSVLRVHSNRPVIYTVSQGDS
jgi:hypothetical protein